MPPVGVVGTRIAVLGAGIQGACVALALAARGAKVDLYERRSVCLAETSTHNTGKVHLGLVYARDRTLATAKLLAGAVLCFAPLLRRWLGAKAVASVPTSLPDHYVIHRHGLITPDDFEQHGRQVAASLQSIHAERGGDYFGGDLPRAPVRLSDDELTLTFNPETATAAYSTDEVSIDTEGLAEIIHHGIAAEPAVNCLMNRKVVGVRDAGQCLIVTSATGGGFDREGYDFVVNALWTGRLAIDRQLGVAPESGWCFRFRYFLRAVVRGKIKIPSTTVLLGPYGELVRFADGRTILSWYPAGLSNWSTAIEPPSFPCHLEGRAAAELAARTCEGLGTIIPAVAGITLEDLEVRGGWIFAFGDTDIDDPNSRLHHRSSVGARRYGRYLTVDTGKLTLAPLFAEQAVSLMME